MVSRLSHVAQGEDTTRRMDPEVGPFLAVAEEGIDDHEATKLVQPGETVVVVGVKPNFSSTWNIQKQAKVVQMVFAGSAEHVHLSGPRLLTESDLPDMLALTALVYPHYFRPRTASLGNYYGVYQGRCLVAMAGCRLNMPGFQEISAVCTHPDFRGKGLAQHLTKLLAAEIQARGDTPFLHLDHDNTVARAVYEKVGFTHARDIPMWVVEHI